LVNYFANEIEQGHHIVCDNFFTSVDLVHDLKKSGYKATGTIKKKKQKGLPSFQIEKVGQR
jgi:hypothetical protein